MTNSWGVFLIPVEQKVFSFLSSGLRTALKYFNPSRKVVLFYDFGFLSNKNYTVYRVFEKVRDNMQININDFFQ